MVHEKRMHAGLSLRQLSRETGLSHNYLSRLESGEFSDVKLTVLIRLTRRLAFSNQELYLATGCALTDELPEIESYLRAKYPEWSAFAVSAVSDYCRYTDEKQKGECGSA